MFADTITKLEGIDLATLDETVGLGTRRDRKYLLTESGANRFVAGLDPATRALDIDGSREFWYDSMYFDTGDLMCFLLAEKGRRRRFKVRTRHYAATDERWLEVKTRGPRGLTIKDRTRFNDYLDCEWVRTILAVRGIDHVPVEQFVPTAQVTYDRTTLALPDHSKVTIDRRLTWRSYETTRQIPGLVIVETKTRGTANLADRWLWSHGVRPCHLSKYATGMAVLFPYLKANRWHPTLTRLSQIQEKNHENSEMVDPYGGLFGDADPRRMHACRPLLG